jgi:hypothetical protein
LSSAAQPTASTDSFMFKVGYGIGRVPPGMYEVDALPDVAWCTWSVYGGDGVMFGGVIPTTGGVSIPEDATILLLQRCGDLRDVPGAVEPAGPQDPAEEVV